MDKIEEHKLIKLSFIKGNLWIGLGQFLLNIRGLILLPILIRILGISSYGAYLLLASTAGLISHLSSLGVGFRYKRYMPSLIDRKRKSEMFYHQFLFHGLSLLVVLSLVVFTDKLVKSIFFKNSVSYSAYILSFFIFMNFFSFQMGGYFRLTNRMKYFTISQAGVPYTEIVIIILMAFAYRKLGINHILLAHIFALLIISIPLFIKLVNEIGFELPRLHFRVIIEDMRFGLPLLGTLILDTILSIGDRYIISFFMTSRDVGVYAPAYTLGSLIRFIPQLYVWAMPVFLSKLFDRDNIKDAKILLTYCIKVFLLCAVLSVIICLIFGRQLLEILATKAVADQAFAVTPIVSLGILFYGLNVIIGEVLFIKLKTKLIFAVSLIGAILNIALNIILIYLFKNIIMAAITTFISYFVCFIILNRYIKSYSIINYDFSSLLRIVLAALIVVGVSVILLSFLPKTSVIIIGLSVFSIAVFIVLNLVFKVITKKQVFFLVNVWRIR